MNIKTCTLDLSIWNGKAFLEFPPCLDIMSLIFWTSFFREHTSSSIRKPPIILDVFIYKDAYMYACTYNCLSFSVVFSLSCALSLSLIYFQSILMVISDFSFFLNGWRICGRSGISVCDAGEHWKMKQFMKIWNFIPKFY